MGQISTKEEISAIYLKHQRLLYQLALTYVHSADEAEELAAEAIVAILEQTLVFENERRCLCYLKRIVRNKAIDQIRRKYKILPDSYENIEVCIAALHANREQPATVYVETQLLLQGFLSEYSQEIREAFIAHVLDDETIPTLAAQYGMKTDTLRKQIGRMKKRIAAAISEQQMHSFLYLLLLFS